MRPTILALLCSGLLAASEPSSLDLAAAPEVSAPVGCEVSIVGAGWAGTYAAYRIAVDSKAVDAK